MGRALLSHLGQLSLLVFLLMAFCATLDVSSWFTAALQGSQGMRMADLRSSFNEVGNKKLDVQFYPIPETRYETLRSDEYNRRKLAPFQLCSGCTCCAATENNKNVCTMSACCYSITCGLPDKPYGVCAFTPKACNCTSCGSSWTHSMSIYLYTMLSIMFPLTPTSWKLRNLWFAFSKSGHGRISSFSPNVCILRE